MFRGLQVAEKEPMASWYRAWVSWITLFDRLRDENGDFRHYPYSGGYWDQKAIEMDVLGVIRDVYKQERKRCQDQQRRSSYGSRI